MERNDQISISAGSFRAFKVIADVNGTPIEATWFDTSLGQIVRGEYYNDKEEVTQTLVAYSENNPAMSTFLWFICLRGPCLGTLRKLYLQQIQPPCRVENFL